MKSRTRPNHAAPRALHVAPLALVLSLCLSATVLADDATEEITVMASRVTSTAVSAALPVEVIDATELHDRQSLAIADALRARNSVAIAQNGPIGGLTEFRLRGAESNHVQVRMDGIVLNDPAIGSSVDMAHLSLIGVTQMEILRGAQSGVWGSDALAGVLTLSTRPSADSRLRRISIEGGSDETQSTALALADANETTYYAISANHFDTDGTNASLQGNEDDGYRNTTGHAHAGYTGERWSAEAVLRYTDARSEFDPTPFPEFIPMDGDSELDVNQLYGRLGIGFKARDNWHHRLSYNYLDSENENAVSGSTTDSTEGGRDLLTYQTDIYFGTDVPQRLTLAYEHSKEDYTQRGEASFFGDPNYDEDVEIDSAIGEYEIAYGQLTAVLSLRYDDNSDFDNDTTYRLATRYDLPTGNTTLFAGYGKGSKNPTFTERFGFTPDTFIGNPDLQPEESTNLNLGVEQRFAYGEIRFNVFRDRLTDEIDGFFFDPVLLGFTAVNRAGTSSRDGVEVMSQWQLPRGFAIEFDYSYLDASESQSGDDEDELRRPEHTARMALRYTGSDRFDARLGVDYVGERDDIDFSTFERVTLADYALLHLAARYRFNDHFALHGRIENVLDEDYQDVFGYRSVGRRFMIGVSADF